MIFYNILGGIATMAKEKVVLAYSGGLDTSIIIPWLKENYDYDVIAVCGDVGQGKETDGLEERAKKAGASKLYIEDLRDDYVKDYIFPTLKAGAVYEGKYLLGTSHARPIIAKRLVEIAHKEGAVAICHGATGKGNDQVRFELGIKALDPSLKETAIKMIHKFHEAGAYISFDVNYRASLWSEEEAKKTVEAIFPYVDFLFVSEETSRRMLQRTGTLEEIMKGYADTYGCTLIATTRREAVSPTHHNFNSKIYMNGNFYEEEPYNNIEVIDRIGSGDAYLAGVLYGLIKFGTPERAIEIGNALSAVKNTVAGDMSASSIEEIESVIKSHKATGHQDEMVR